MRLRIRGAGARGGRRSAALAALLALALAAPLTATADADSARRAAPSADDIRQYEIHVDHNTPVTRTAIAAAGVTVDEADEETVVVSGRAGQIRKLRQQGYSVSLLGSAPDRTAEDDDLRLYDFPSADSKYHNYAEMNAEIDQRIAAYPNIMSKRVIGKSYQGRDIVAIKISDNVATDELMNLAGVDRINRLTRELGLPHTHITADLRTTLDDIAGEAGFASYAAMVEHDPNTMGEPSAQQIEAAVVASAALDPSRGTRTTASDTVQLLQAIWTDRAGPRPVCASVRRSMARQLTRNRIASAFEAPVSVAAKSGGLLGVVRNEAGVVSFPDGGAYAVAVFTRRPIDNRVDPAVIDTTIGTIGRILIDQLRKT
jgi:hypothetical protein